IRRICKQIRVNELRIIVQDVDDQVMDFYEEVTAKCAFDLLHLSIWNESERISELIRQHSSKKMHIAFSAVFNLEILREIQVPGIYYFSKYQLIEPDLLRCLIKSGHTLEMVQCQEIKGKEMGLVREIAEMLRNSTTDQLVSLDVPIVKYDAEFTQSHPLGGPEEWAYNG
ncbi:hypothetical protein PENTCL1PPCAC_18890, partial [Pristionchus entomophagus]